MVENVLHGFMTPWQTCITQNNHVRCGIKIRRIEPFVNRDVRGRQ